MMIPQKKPCLFWFSLASVIYLALTLVCLSPYLTIFSSALIGPPEDNMQYLWNLWFGQNWSLETRLLFYPEGASLLYHTMCWTNIAIVFIVSKIFSIPPTLGNLTIFHNCLVLFSFYMSAMGAFYLAKHFTKNAAFALIAGFIYAFSPMHYGQSLYHIGLAQIQYLPFFVLFFIRFVETRRVGYFVGAAILYALAAYTHMYFLVYCGYFLLFYYIYEVVRQRRLLVREVALPIIGVIAITLLVLSPLIWPMLVEGLKNQRVYGIGFYNVCVADLFGFFVFHPYHLLWKFAEPVNRLFTGNSMSMSVYLGVVNIFFIVWAIIRKKAAFFLFASLVFVVLSMGSYLHILGKPLPVPLTAAVTQAIPLLKNVRFPSWFMQFAYLFIGVVVSVAVEDMWQRYPKKTCRIGIVILLVLMVADFFPGRWESMPAQCPKAYDLIKADSSKFGILDLPNGHLEGNYYMMYQICHGRPIVNATLSRKLVPTLADRLERTWGFDFERELRTSRVKYIVLHKDLLLGNGQMDERYTKDFKSIYEDDRNIVFKVYE